MVVAELARPPKYTYPDDPIDLVIVDESTIEKEWGWIFFYNSDDISRPAKSPMRSPAMRHILLIVTLAKCDRLAPPILLSTILPSMRGNWLISSRPTQRCNRRTARRGSAIPQMAHASLAVER